MNATVSSTDPERYQHLVELRNAIQSITAEVEPPPWSQRRIFNIIEEIDRRTAGTQQEIPDPPVSQPLSPTPNS